MVLLRSPSAQALKNATCLTPGKAVLTRKEVVHHDESGGWLFFNRRIRKLVVRARPAQLAELPRSEFDPELFPHSAYVKFFVTFATKVPYLTFCDKM